MANIPTEPVCFSNVMLSKVYKLSNIIGYKYKCI